MFGAEQVRKVPFILPKIDVANFTGRADELRSLELQLLGTNPDKACSIVGLSGGGGMGKSALAFHFATEYRDQFPDGVIGLPVDGKAVHEVARDFARFCGQEIDEEDSRSASMIMQDVFAHRQMLLIFDNADRAELKALRPGGNRCALIVTTRDRQIPNSFGIANAGTIDLPPMPKKDARALLRQILGTERVDAELDAADRIIQMTGGLPLALQIAGSALSGGGWDLTTYAEALKDEKTRVQRLLISDDQDLNVTASLNLSLQLLKKCEIDLFACLSVCAKDGFSLKTAMIAGGIKDNYDARVLIGRLYQLSLLNKVSPDRYVFHALVRVYAQDQARDRQLLEIAAQRHAEYFIDFVKSNDLETVENAQCLMADFDDILQAAEWLRSNSTSDELKTSAYQFALNLRPFLLKYNYSKRAVELMSGFQEWAESLNDWSTSVKFSIQHAKYLMLEGQLIEAEEVLRNAQCSIDRISDLNQRRESQVKQLSSLGSVFLRQDKVDKAIDTLEQQIALEEVLSDKNSLTIVLNRLGGLFQQCGRLNDAIVAFKRQIKISEVLNDQNSLAIGLNCLGGVFQQQGKLDEAIDAFERQIKIAEIRNDQNSLTIGLNCLGGVFQQQGKLDEAIDAFERQIKIAEVFNDQNSLAIRLNRLGGLFQQQGRLDDAIATFEHVVTVEERIGESRGLAMALSSLCSATKERGDIDTTISILNRILTLEEKLKNYLGVAMTLRTLGGLMRSQGHFVPAIDVLRRASKIDQGLGDSIQYTKSLSILAETLYGYGCEILNSPISEHQAELFLNESYEIYDQINDLFHAAASLHSLGIALKGKNKLIEAEDCLQKSRDTFTEIKQKTQLIRVLNTLGEVLERKKDWKSAEMVLREGYNFAFEEQDILYQAKISNNLGKLFAKQKGEKNFALSNMYFMNSIKLGQISDDSLHLARAYTAWGRSLIHHGKPEDALAQLHQAFEIDEQSGKTNVLRDLLDNLTNVFTRLGRSQEALQYFDRAIVATNSNASLIAQKESFVRSFSSPTAKPRKKNPEIQR